MGPLLLPRLFIFSVLFLGGAYLLRRYYLRRPSPRLPAAEDAAEETARRADMLFWFNLLVDVGLVAVFLTVLLTAIYPGWVLSLR